MGEEGISSKGRRACTVAHWFLVAITVLSAVAFVIVFGGALDSIVKYGLLTGANVDQLMSIAAIIGVTLLIDCIVRRIRSGVPPFAEENSRSFLLMAWIVFAKVLLSTVTQAAIFFTDAGFNKSFFFSIDSLIALVVLLILHMIFKYGSTLQAEVQDLV